MCQPSGHCRSAADRLKFPWAPSPDAAAPSILLTPDYHLTHSRNQWPGVPRVGLVAGFEALRGRPFGPDCNALCWPRAIEGDFDGLVQACAPEPGIQGLDPDLLLGLRLAPAAALARAQVLADWQLLSDAGLDPALEIVHGYCEPDSSGPVATHVRSFHVDRADIEVDTWICSYSGKATEGLCNDDAVRHVDVPATRALLQARHGGPVAELDAWLAAGHYDLHYAELPGARLWSFGRGNLWRIACLHPGSRALPCIHRAPAHQPGDPPRLLLLA